MATNFLTKELQNLGTTPTPLTGTYTSGDVTVHAIYASNTHATDTIGFYLVLYDNSSTNQIKANILYNVEISPKSTLVVEKPINLTASDTGATQRQLKVHASTGTDLDVVASILEIT